MEPLQIFNYRLVDRIGIKSRIGAGYWLVWSRGTGTISIRERTGEQVYFQAINGDYTAVRPNTRPDDKLPVAADSEAELLATVLAPLAWKYELNWKAGGKPGSEPDTLCYKFC